MRIKACLSHNSDDWRTPTNMYKWFMEHEFIDTFPYQSKYDEFEKEYHNKRLFINPPFSKMKKVTTWIIQQIKNNNHIVLLIPSRTDTTYFHKLLEFKPHIIFVKGRLKYNDKGTAPFPSIMLIFDPDDRTKRIFDIGIYSTINNDTFDEGKK